MYPDFEYLLESLFGTNMPEWLSIFKTFGFFVAMAFLAAAYTLTRELKRKEAQGLLQPTISTTEVGKPASANELLGSALTGFVLGYKVGGMFGNVSQVSPDPMGYMFSLQGNLLIGIIGALLLGYIRYSEKKKQQLPEPKIEKTLVHPHQRVLEIIIIAAITGMAGAKIFNAFETWDQFLEDPIASLFSSSGLTFYGGLILATISLYIYSRKHKIPFQHLCDAVAPGLILAYGVGRLGCHFAGDGDWGIFNSAYITDYSTGALRAAAKDEFQQIAANVPAYYKDLQLIPHIYAPAPSWLPDWVFGMNYAHNVNHEGLPIPGCTGTYCTALPVSVFPTPIYEFAVCMILFAILWSLRRKLKYPLQLFGIYLVLNGIERFFIEKIRVNYKYDWGFIRPTQAEIISTLLVIAGLAIFYIATRHGKKKAG